MNENAVFQEDSFSFKKIFDLLKRSAKRMLIYGLISAVIGAAVVSIIVLTTREDIDYKGIVEYNYQNIDEGLDPKGNVLEVSRIKSNSIINNALSAMGNVSSEQAAKILPIIADDIIVTGYISDAMRTALERDTQLTYFPSRYEISIKYNPKTGLSKNQYLDFLNKLMESYTQYFYEYYNYGNIMTLIVNENTVANSNDYINAIKTYENEISNIQAQINSLPTTYVQIKNRLQARVNILGNQVNELSTYILKKNVQKVGSTMTLTQYLDNEIAKCGEQKTIYGSKATNIKAILADYKIFYEQITNTGSTLSVTVADTTYYNSLVAEYQYASSQEAYYSTKKAEYEREKGLLTGFESTGTERVAVESKFTELYTSLISELENINEELTNYSKLNLLSNGVKVAMSATSKANISYIAAVVSFVIIELAGILIAIVVTYHKQNKRAKLSEAKDSEEVKSDD